MHGADRLRRNAGPFAAQHDRRRDRAGRARAAACRRAERPRRGADRPRGPPRSPPAAAARGDRNPERAAHRAAQRLPAERVGRALEGDDAGRAEGRRGAHDRADVPRILQAREDQRPAAGPTPSTSRRARPPVGHGAIATTPDGCWTGLMAARTWSLTVSTRPPRFLTSRAMRATRRERVAELLFGKCRDLHRGCRTPALRGPGARRRAGPRWRDRPRAARCRRRRTGAGRATSRDRFTTAFCRLLIRITTYYRSRSSLGSLSGCARGRLGNSLASLAMCRRHFLSANMPVVKERTPEEIRGRNPAAR